MLFSQLNHASCKTYLIGTESSNIILIDPVLEHVNDYIEYLDKKNLKLLS